MNITCLSADATIRYTTDGTTPTVNSPEYDRFKVYNRTTVKAVAFFDNGAASEVTTAEYAKGQCDNPVISPADATTFYSSNQEVSIAWSGDDGTLRYTTDGNDPTASSPAYVGPFTISETTTVKAKAFGNQYFDSLVVTSVLTRAWEQVSTPVISVPVSFSGAKTVATIMCATDGAVIRYTLDGSEPNSHSAKYTGVIDITGTTTIKAIAMLAGNMTSEVMTVTVTKIWCIGDAMNDPDRAFTTDVTDGWGRDTDVSKDGVESMRSGNIGDSTGYGMFNTSTMSTVVNGKGTVSFWWKASCESDDEYEWDHGEFRANGEVLYINGTTDWQEVTYTFNTDGNHEICWVYLKDDFGMKGQDCIWVDQFTWTPALAYTETQTTSTPVPYSWLEKYNLASGGYLNAEAYESAAKSLAANGKNTIEECYVAGLDPTNETDEFMASVEIVDGEVRIFWTPDQNNDGVTRIYTVFGRSKLNYGNWEPVKPWHRIFKVAVAMPTGVAGEKTAVSGDGFVPEEKPLGGVQLWANGPFWAECNVGATKPEEYGYYFWWGDTVGYIREDAALPHDDNPIGATWTSSDGIHMGSTPFAPSFCPTCSRSDAELMSIGFTDSAGSLTAAHDAATVHLGTPWRMPSYAEFLALINNCTTTWTTRNGVYGRLVTGKDDYLSKSIFLPAGGHAFSIKLFDFGSSGQYWSSTGSDFADFVYAEGLGFDSDRFGWGGGGFRFNGLLVRPLRDYIE